MEDKITSGVPNNVFSGVDSIGSQTMAQGCQTPSREKFWSELDSAAQIERLRTVVKSLEYQVRDIHSRYSKMKKHFYTHDHSADGKITTPVTEYDSYSEYLPTSLGGVPTNPNEVYF